ncbi:hypothetical protein EV668_1654 [Enterovirga rhinocerotis]|uniref:Uncharacterized protein n=1 Tax=Enterovirga rhinocerotis TaxID=1339210 RepID=A0A4R7C7J0_9HYPH|nr:hypothetical protein EV668_1654 [Enterovirga rhinocerotis]
MMILPAFERGHRLVEGGPISRVLGTTVGHEGFVIDRRRDRGRQGVQLRST